MELRAAQVADVDVVVALVESAYRGEASRAGWTTEADLIDGGRTDAEEITALLPDLVLAVEGDEVLGCAAMSVKGEVGYFGTFAVRPASQGRGVGARLLAAAEDRARAAGLTCVEMTVLSGRSELIAYYARRGYAANGQTRPFPYGVARHGRPRTDDLEFAVLVKQLTKPLDEP